MNNHSRNESIDMAKGILIGLVVLGHMEINETMNTIIFWFHVPAFFILSGVFLRNENIQLWNEIIRKWKRLMIPYFIYSLILGTIAREGNVIKQLIGTIMGAGGNITSFTFPYYFITVLFVSSVLYYVLCKKINNKKYFWITIFGFYVLSQVWCKLMPDYILNWIPWNIDEGVYALTYLSIGSLLSNQLKCVPQNYILLLTNSVCALLIVSYCIGGINYHYNFKSHEWIPIIDLLIPTIFTFSIVYDMRLLSKIPIVRLVFEYVGNSSLTILFLHSMFKCINYELPYISTWNEYGLAFIIIIECLITHWILFHFKYFRFLTSTNL